MTDLAPPPPSRLGEDGAPAAAPTSESGRRRGGTLASRATTALIRMGVLCVLAQLSMFMGVWDDERSRLSLERFGNAADAIAAHLERSEDGLVLRLPKRAVESSPLRGGMRAEVLGLDGRRLAAVGVETLPSLPPPLPTDDEFVLRAIDTPAGRETVLIAQTHVDGLPVWIRIFGGPATEWSLWVDALKEFAHRTWIPMAGMLLMIPLVNIAMVRQALAPLADAAARARSAGSDPDQRSPLDSPDLPEEIHVLARAADDAFDRLRGALAAQKTFVADAAHELRTPLATLTLRLESMPDCPEKEEARQDAQMMKKLVDRLEQAAQADVLEISDSARANLHEVCADVVAAMAPLAIRQGREIELVAPPAATPSDCLVVGDGLAAWQAVRNLVENALRHSPPGGLVTVRVEGGRVWVRDRGPGVAPADRQAVFQRFWRADKSRVEGAGLGLSIVWRIMQAHEGSAHVVAPAEGPGAEFVLCFRLPSPDSMTLGRGRVV